jgi:hypothetical protein
VKVGESRMGQPELMVIDGRKYRHYKNGKLYTLISDAFLHTETNEIMVAYMNNLGQLFVRPYAMFFETFPDGNPRFKCVDEGGESYGLRTT